MAEDTVGVKLFWDSWSWQTKARGCRTSIAITTKTAISLGLNFIADPDSLALKFALCCYDWFIDVPLADYGCRPNDQATEHSMVAPQISVSTTRSAH
jgi:hypothetical protein